MVIQEAENHCRFDCTTEYMATSDAGRELVWVRTLLHILRFSLANTTPLLCDNTDAMLLCGDQAFHNCVKHLDVKYHWICKRIESGELLVGQIPTSGNVADAMMKALSGLHFTVLCNCLGVCQCETGIGTEGECKDKGENV